jgi:hypothetical protein
VVQDFVIKRYFTWYSQKGLPSNNNTHQHMHCVFADTLKSVCIPFGSRIASPLPLSCQDWRQVIRWGGVDVWRLTSVSRQDWRHQVIFFHFLWRESIFWGAKKGKKHLFPLKSGPLGGNGGTVHDHRTHYWDTHKWSVKGLSDVLRCLVLKVCQMS